MAFTVNQTPRLQIGDAKLGSTTDQIALIWQTKGSNSGDSFVVEYRPANSNGTWQTADAPTTIDTRTEGRINHSTTITGLDYSAEYEYRVQHFRNGSLVNTYPLTGVNGNRATFVRDTDGEYAKGAGVVQVISGMGGKSQRDGGYSGFPFVASGYSQSTNPRSEDGFSKISVTENRLTVEYK
ncbi:MAG: fibronectin type III domain-containing protein [Xenococcaceae cyanobacterium]